jgi:AsmA protein
MHALGGDLEANGSRLKLAHPSDPFHLEARAQGIDVAAAAGMFSSQKVVAGRLDGQLDLVGGGAPQASLAQSLSGVLSGTLSGGIFYGKDLVAGVAGPLAKAIPFGAAGKEAKGGETRLGKDLPFALRIRNGVAQFERPLEISEPEANISVGGSLGIDGSVDLSGTVALAPSTIARITGGRVRPQGSIPVTYRLTGPAQSPQLRDLGLGPAAEAILKEAGVAAIGRSLGLPIAGPQEPRAKAKDVGGQIEQEAKQRLEGLLR